MKTLFLRGFPPERETHPLPAYIPPLSTPHNLMLPPPSTFSSHNHQTPCWHPHILSSSLLLRFRCLTASHRAIVWLFQLVKTDGTFRKQAQTYHWFTKLEILRMGRNPILVDVLIYDAVLGDLVRLIYLSVEHPLDKPGEFRGDGRSLQDLGFGWICRSGLGRHETIGSTEVHSAATKIASPGAL